MLKTRIITAVVLLAVLLLAILSGSIYVFAGLAVIFFAGAAWEALRLFNNRYAIAGALVWSAALVWVIFSGSFRQSVLLCGLCAAIWVVRLVPALKLGLPSLQGFGNRLLTGIYGVAILGAFIALMISASWRRRFRRASPGRARSAVASPCWRSARRPSSPPRCAIPSRCSCI
jgi:phosphatidate cytidylyltransferase